MLSLEALQLIDLITRTGSFSAAAKACDRVPSAVSYAVKNVEDELGILLFKRSHKSIELTEAGAYFVVEGRRVLECIETLKRESRRIANGWLPRLSVVVDTLVSSERIVALATDFHERFDNVQLNVLASRDVGVWNALMEGKAEIAIGASTQIPVNDKFCWREMGSIEWTLAVGCSHPLAARSEPLTNEDLSRFRTICVDDGHIDVAAQVSDLLPGQHKLVVPDWRRAAQCVEEGLGIGYMPLHVASPKIRAGTLIAKNVAVPRLPRMCCVAWRVDRLSPAMTWLLDYLGGEDKMRQEWLC
ncbi:DNA-binding transcriptional activator PunR [Paraburkholderia sp. J69-1]|uniref:DNA-binding transcriptional activator PunR n=1 Tax=Paraburkholderia sp. J69-1 TaxID=2805436 RepID=UPI002AB5ED17|nr:DNA-binding transcriptional activator PunR [Paraburkholderia sp. J69-1]